MLFRSYSSDPMWQEPSYQLGLQQLVDIAHHRQMLVSEQAMLNQTEQHLTERRTELAALLRQYAALQRQLESQTDILQQYIAEHQTLREEIAQNNPQQINASLPRRWLGS